MQKIFAPAIGIYRDGYGLLGAIAPAISAAGSICKLAGVEMLSLQDISWAWMLAPITAWLAIAYFRRWHMYQQHIEATPTPDMPLADALEYVGQTPDIEDAIKQYEKVKDAASLGKLPFWGYRNNTLVPVDPSEWEHGDIDWTTVWDETGPGARLTVQIGVGPQTVYEKIKTSRSVVARIWTRKKR